MNHIATIMFCFCCFTGMAQSQSPILLFPQGAPGEKDTLTEYATSQGDEGEPPVVRYYDISKPGITVYPADKQTANGMAVIVCPGGGYNLWCYDKEGSEVCTWLNKLGITAVLLKYRVPRREGKLKHEAPLQDVQRAISYVRFHAKTWDINPGKIGIMGFSAGGHLSVMASTCFGTRTYPAIDEADSATNRPDFCLLIYPAYLEGQKMQLAQEINIQSNTPPTMIIHTEDDKPFINGSLVYYAGLKEMGIPVWMHLYASGGHGYGIRNRVNEWPKRAEEWFKEIDGAVAN